MRCENFAQNECYEVYGKGLRDEKIFTDDADKVRFIFLLTHMQSPIRVYNVSWYTEMYLKKNSFSIQENKLKDMLKKRSVELIAFSITPGCFHLLVKNLEEGLLSVYMQRVLTAYSKYFNAKYGKRGHVFEGPFGATCVKNNAELAHLSACIHKNAGEIKGWENNYEKYPYSSYQDYIGTNRWGHFLSPEIVLKQFKDQTHYKDFVKKTPRKSPLSAK